MGLRISLKASSTSKTRPTDLTTEFTAAPREGLDRIILLYTANLRHSAHILPADRPHCAAGLRRPKQMNGSSGPARFLAPRPKHAKAARSVGGASSDVWRDTRTTR